MNENTILYIGWEVNKLILQINKRIYLILRFFRQKIVEKSALSSDFRRERSRLLDFPQLE